MAYVFRTRTDGLGHPVAFDRDYGPYTGHAMDPRTPDDDGDDPIQGIRDAEELIGRAERAMLLNRRACADLLREAAELLQAVADEVAS